MQASGAVWLLGQLIAEGAGGPDHGGKVCEVQFNGGEAEPGGGVVRLQSREEAGSVSGESGDGGLRLGGAACGDYEVQGLRFGAGGKKFADEALAGVEAEAAGGDMSAEMTASSSVMGVTTAMRCRRAIESSDKVRLTHWRP